MAATSCALVVFGAQAAELVLGWMFVSVKPRVLLEADMSGWNTWKARGSTKFLQNIHSFRKEI